VYAIAVRLPLRAGLGEDEVTALVERAEREIVAPVAQLPGFRAYYAVRVGDTEALLFHVWATREQAEAGSARLGELTERLLGEAVAGPPQRTAGPVVIHRGA
jgi:hypothetical protein